MSNRMALASFSFSNNLVEIGALTALVGSTTAESLVLGNRGAAGVAWAGISAFGAVSVAKACLAGACPGWVREILGIRSGISDDAVGFEMDMTSRLAVRAGRGTERLVAISRHRGRTICVYTPNEYTRIQLAAIPETAADRPIRIRTPADYAYMAPHRTIAQVVIHASSLWKFLEVSVLWSLGAQATTIASIIPWAYFFFGAILLDINDSRRIDPNYGELDIAAGELPTSTHPGGSRTIILGTAPDPRNGPLWTVFWATGAPLVVTSIVATYITLSFTSRNAVLAWAAFQLLWLALRTLVHYVLPPAERTFQPLFRPGFRGESRDREYATMSISVKERIVNLVLALGEARTIGHRRGREHYMADSFELSVVRLMQKYTVDIYPLTSTQAPKHLQVTLRGIVGDTTLVCALWMQGASGTPIGPYYCCVVLFTNSQSQTFAVPAVRILSGISIFNQKHSEDRQTRWWYWVPCEGNRWLEFRLAGKAPVTQAAGAVYEAAVRSDRELDAFVTSGGLNSSGLKGLQEVKIAVELARRGRDAMMQLLGA